MVRARDEAPRTVRNLADRYLTDYLAGKSTRSQEKQEGVLRLHVLPAVGGRLVKDWTSAESERVLTKARNARRIVHVQRAVEQPARGKASIKLPKNDLTRTSIFPKSLADSLAELVEEVTETVGPNGLLFPSKAGHIMRRTTFQQVWIHAADEAGWPMTSPRKKTRGYGKKNKGWRWTGAAKWTPHDLRHVAACWMLFDLGLDAAVVAEFLGHADPSFTVRRYVGVRGNPEEAATRATDEW